MKVIFSILFVASFSYYTEQVVSFSFSPLALVPAVLYLIVRNNKKGFRLFSIIYGVYLAFNLQALLEGARLILNEGIMAFARMNILFPLQQTDEIQGTVIISLLLFAISTLLHIPLALWGVLSTVVLLPFLLQQPLPLLAFVLVLLSGLLLMQKHINTIVSLLPFAAVAIAVGGVYFIPYQLSVFQTAGDAVQELYAAVRYGESDNTQFTNGDFRELDDFRKDSMPAFTMAGEAIRPMYLKSFVGSKYHNGWQSNNDEMLKDQAVVESLTQTQYMETQYAQAANGETEKVTIQHKQLSRQYALFPYELAESDNFIVQENRLKTRGIFGASHYQLPISARSYSEYPLIASELYAAVPPEYEEKERLNNYISYKYFKDIPDDIRTLLHNHVGDVKHESYEQTIVEVQQFLTGIHYNESPKKADNEDFLLFLLEESKEGYSIHYATLATMLFRYYGVPARYVEGYIVTEDDLSKKPKELTVTSDGRHAWTEIYIDWIGWVPIEVTPGYAEKMPAVATLEYTQQQSTSSPNTGQSTSIQATEETFEEKPTEETVQNRGNYNWLWMLLFLLVGFVLFFGVRMYYQNRNQRYFLSMMKAAKKKLRVEAAIHEVIAQLEMEEALAAYRLYNELTYSGAQNVDAKQMRRLTKIVRRRLRRL